MRYSVRQIPIHLQETPPTSADIVAVKQACVQALRIISQRNRLATLAGFGLCLAGLALVAYFWWHGVTTQDTEWSLMLFVMFGAVMALTFTLSTLSIDMFVLALWLPCVGILLGLLAGIAFDTVALLFLGSGAGVAGMLIGFIVTIYFFDGPRDEVTKTLASLSELNHSVDPDACIQYVQWCDEDETVRAYQRRLVSLGRRPILAEYNAAKEWVRSAIKQRGDAKKAAEAQRACQRLAVQ